MSTTDLYAVLGVLPEAEDVVVTAAYRALAQRYHPDKWRGDASEAHQRMSQINEAYRVLSDKTLRAEYDRTRTSSSQEFGSPNQAEQEEAFDEALKDFESRWELAVTIFPDLKDIRTRLGRVSKSLAFSFAVGLLDTKRFDVREALASRLEQTFLERYFGTDAHILQYAKQLIFQGHRDAARALNRLVDVLGSGVDSKLLIDRIEMDFGFRAAKEQAARALAERTKLKELATTVRNMGYYQQARELAEQLGYTVTEAGGGLFRAAAVAVSAPEGATASGTMVFKNSTAFVHWVNATLARPLLSAP